MLSLQTSVSGRLTTSEDSQVVQSSFRNDVQSAQEITTSATSSDQCGSGYQVLGLGWNFNPANHAYQTIVSYVTVPETTGSTTTYSLLRQMCTNVTPSSPTQITPVTSSSVVATDFAITLAASEVPPNVYPSSVGTPATSNWTSTSGLTTVSWPISESQGTTASAPTYSYTLVASPPISSSTVQGGSPITATTQAGCGYAAAGSGTYASSLCLVDFSGLSGNNMVAARQGCVELSIPLPGGSTLYFCIAISGAPVAPYALPTWTDGFLGNSINGVPFYSDVPGDPALYQSCEGSSSTCVVNGNSVPNTWGGVTTITISDITVVAPDGNPATGWEFVSADAESTDDGESIQWTSNQNMYIIPNNQSVDSASDPIGNACNGGASVSGTLTTSTSSTAVSAAQIFAGQPATSITCGGASNGTKTGTLMVESGQPTSMTITMVGTGLEGISFGLLF
jgi:hypothetical protein